MRPRLGFVNTVTLMRRRRRTQIDVASSALLPRRRLVGETRVAETRADCQHAPGCSLSPWITASLCMTTVIA